MHRGDMIPNSAIIGTFDDNCACARLAFADFLYSSAKTDQCEGMKHDADLVASLDVGLDVHDAMCS
jgi:hypothetical protein